MPYIFRLFKDPAAIAEAARSTNVEIEGDIKALTIGYNLSVGPNFILNLCNRGTRAIGLLFAVCASSGTVIATGATYTEFRSNANLSIGPIFILNQSNRGARVIGLLFAVGAASGTVAAIGETCTEFGSNAMKRISSEPFDLCFAMFGIGIVVIVAAIPSFPVMTMSFATKEGFMSSLHNIHHPYGDEILLQCADPNTRPTLSDQLNLVWFATLSGFLHPNLIEVQHRYYLVIRRRKTGRKWASNLLSTLSIFECVKYTED